MPRIVESNCKPKNGPAPSDADCSLAWEQIMQIAREHSLIVQACGGVATLAVPEEQRKAGIRNKVLRMELRELEDM